jgi:hypothetical protein
LAVQRQPNSVEVAEAEARLDHPEAAEAARLPQALDRGQVAVRAAQEAAAEDRWLW